MLCSDKTVGLYSEWLLLFKHNAYLLPTYFDSHPVGDYICSCASVVIKCVLLSKVQFRYVVHKDETASSFTTCRGYGVHESDELNMKRQPPVIWTTARMWNIVFYFMYNFGFDPICDSGPICDWKVSKFATRPDIWLKTCRFSSNCI